MPSSSDKVQQVTEALEAGLLERQASGAATPQELLCAMTLPFAKQAFADAAADDIDQGIAVALSVAAQFLSDGTPSLLLVPGRGAWWCHVDPLELGDPTGCVHVDLEGTAGDPDLTVDRLLAGSGLRLALPQPDPVRGDDRDR